MAALNMLRKRIIKPIGFIRVYGSRVGVTLIVGSDDSNA